MLFATHVVTLYEAPETFHPTLILKLSDLAFRIQLFGQQRSNFIDQGELNLRAMIKFSLDSLDIPQYEFIHQDFVFFFLTKSHTDSLMRIFTQIWIIG